MTYLKRNNIYVKQSDIHGYGVFAEVEIAPGELIEECHSILIKEKCPSLKNYQFGIPKEGLKDYTVIPLGYGCIYNHSNTPNAGYEVDLETFTVTFTAKERIKPGEEICTSYGKNWFAIRAAPVTQRTLKYKLKKLFIRENYLRRMILVTSFVMLLTLYVSS